MTLSDLCSPNTLVVLMALVAMTRARCGRRSKDTALPLAVMGRLGGDEFALVLNIADGEPRAAAKAMLHAIRQIGPTSASGSRLGASIGLAVVDGSGTTPADVLARADDACYAAKSMGRNCWQFEAEQPSGSGMTAAQLVADLATGMGEGRLVLFGQEIRVLDRPDQAAGRIEVLVRLRSRDGRLVSPAEFIPAAERFGMAAALDRHVIRTALRSFGQLLSARTDMSLSHSRKPPSYRADRDHETLKNCAA